MIDFFKLLVLILMTGLIFDIAVDIDRLADHYTQQENNND